MNTMGSGWAVEESSHMSGKEQQRPGKLPSYCGHIEKMLLMLFFGNKSYKHLKFFVIPSFGYFWKYHERLLLRCCPCQPLIGAVDFSLQDFEPAFFFVSQVQVAGPGLVSWKQVQHGTVVSAGYRVFYVFRLSFREKESRFPPQNWTTFLPVCWKVIATFHRKL